MAQIHGQSRQQIQLICWEQFIDSEHPVRVVDLFVDILDLAKLGYRIKGKSKEGRPAYQAKTLLKLYLYGYLNRIRSSRQLEKAAQRNIELFWLLHQVQPGYKTIADFRKDNPKALLRTFKTFNNFLKGEDLLQTDVVAIDGTKIAAQNSKKNNYNEKKIKQHLDYNNRKIEQYLQEMEALDQEEQAEEEALVEVAEKLDHYTAQKAKYEQLDKQLQAVRTNHQAQLSTVDPDARALPKKMNIVEMSYNVQTAVEGQDKLITNFEITNENDTYALSSVAIEAKKVLEKDHLKVLADKGYDTGHELKICSANNIETYVSPRRHRYAKKDPEFTKDKFIYDASTHSYTCPQDKQLLTNGTWYDKYKNKDKQHRKSYLFQRFSAPFATCKSCPFKEKCVGQTNLKRSKGRQIERSEYEEEMEANRERVQLNKDFYRTRQQIVEHPFGTIKRAWGFHYTLLRTIPKVEGELALIFTCYNLRRSMSIFGLKSLIERLEAVVCPFFADLGLFLSPLAVFCLKNRFVVK